MLRIRGKPLLVATLFVVIDVTGRDDVIDDEAAVSTEQTPDRQILPLEHSVPIH
jgi:hypothetical protein